MRNQESYKALIQSIHRSSSMTAIMLTLERNLADQTLSVQQRVDLEHLKRLTSLDVIHVFTAEKLGLHQEAEAIKAFLRKKAARVLTAAQRKFDEDIASDLNRKAA